MSTMELGLLILVTLAGFGSGEEEEGSLDTYWSGTAPICMGGCKGKHKELKRSQCGNGSCCWLGYKSFCRAVFGLEDFGGIWGARSMGHFLRGPLARNYSSCWHHKVLTRLMQQDCVLEQAGGLMQHLCILGLPASGRWTNGSSLGSGASTYSPWRPSIHLGSMSHTPSSLPALVAVIQAVADTLAITDPRSYIPLSSIAYAIAISWGSRPYAQHAPPPEIWYVPLASFWGCGIMPAALGTPMSQACTPACCFLVPFWSLGWWRYLHTSNLHRPPGTFLFSVNCGRPEADFNSMVYGNDWWVGSVVRYGCRPGFLLVGDPASACQSDGHWTPKPTCLRICLRGRIEINERDIDGSCSSTCTDKAHLGAFLNHGCIKISNCVTKQWGWTRWFARCDFCECDCYIPCSSSG